MRRHLYLVSLLVLAFCVSCTDHTKNDEAVLWEYFEGFTYPPSLFDSLKRRAAGEETRLFLDGLRCFEKYDQWDSVSCYDSARIIFEYLIKESPEHYLGYLGKGLLLTERGRKDADKNRPFRHWMDSADSYYASAMQFSPENAAVFYYRGRSQFFTNEDSVNLRAIAYLDTATQIKRDFFKATERSAEFLSHYYDLTNENPEAAAAVKVNFPTIKDRIKYYFALSLTLDSSWYETYRGIAHASHVYPSSERIRYLLKGLDIARRKKSRDTTHFSQYLLDIYFHDLKDFELIKEKLSSAGTDDVEMLLKSGWASYYLSSEGFSEMRQQLMRISSEKASEASWNLYQLHSVNGSFDSAAYFLDAFVPKDTTDGFIKALERAKLYHRSGKTREAVQALDRLLAQAESMWGTEATEHTVYNKAYFLRRYLSGG